MTDDEERQSMQELLAMDHIRRGKLGFWDTPRNVVILTSVLIIAVSAIAWSATGSARSRRRST